MITVILNYHIYRPSIYETIDLYRLKLTQVQIIDLFNHYSSDYFVNSTNILTNSNTMTLYDIIGKYIGDRPELSSKLVNRINPIAPIHKQLDELNISNVHTSIDSSAHKSKYVPVMPFKPLSLRKLDSTRAELGIIGMNTVAGLPTSFNAIYKTARNMIHPTSIIHATNNAHQANSHNMP